MAKMLEFVDWVNPDKGSDTEARFRWKPGGKEAFVRWLDESGNTLYRAMPPDHHRGGPGGVAAVPDRRHPRSYHPSRSPAHRPSCELTE